MSRSPSQHYVIGRDRKCDVVVDDPKVAAFHCRLSREQDRWICTPQDGSIAICRSGAGDLDWSTQAVEIKPPDDVWLTADTRLPWPCESAAARIMTVGRAIDCDITLDHASVSGQHARLIIGPRATLVLKDNSSRNGLFVDASLSQRVPAVMLQPGNSVYFGSYKVSAAELFDATGKPADSRPETEARRVPLITEQPGLARAGPRLKPKPAEAFAWLRQAALIGLPTLVTILVVLVWWSRSDSPVDRRPDLGNMNPPERATLASEAVVAAKPLAEPDETEASSVDPPLVSAPVPTAADNIRKTVYWVLIRHNATNTRYRLGSAVAIAPDKLLTTGSILRSIDELLAHGYSEPAVVLVAGGPLLAVTARTIWPAFSSRAERANTLRKAHEKLVEATKDDRSADELARSARLLNYALSAASAADIGWMDVDGAERYLQIDETVAFRPGQAVGLYNAGFDGKDPFYDPQHKPSATSSIPQTERLRVRGQGPRVETTVGVIQLDCPQSINRDENLIGLPLIRNDTVVGLIVFQATEPVDSSVAMEAVCGRTISNALNSINEDSAPLSGQSP